MNLGRPKASKHVKHTTGWLATPHVSWRWVILASLVWGASLVGIFRSDLGLYLEARISRPLDFRAREALGRSPDISTKLKLYSVDDSTFSMLSSWVLSLEEWGKVLRTVAAAEPRAIFIDQMFSKAGDIEGDMGEFVKQLEGIKVPIIVGSFVSAQPIRYREALDLTRKEFSISSMLGERQAALTGLAPDKLPPMVDRREEYVYGPAKEFQPVFGVGHFVYPGDGKVAPLIRLADDRAVAHIALYLANERKIEGRHLIVDGAAVPVDANGYLTVNFPPPARFFERNFSMRGLLQRAIQGKPSKIVEKGDVVLIIPHMYTGNTDFKHTPFGLMPGGFVIATLLNSVLTGQWLKPLLHSEALIVGGALIGALVGMKLGAFAFWGMSLLVLAGLAAISVYLFSFHGIVAPWLLPSTAFIGAAVTVFAEKTRVSEKKTQKLRLALEGSVAPDDLKSILRNPDRVSFEARERVVSLMFIDVVGFSLLAENMLPRMAFENLKRMLSTIGDTIHAYGGIIDKTLGDGLLCYFGYRFDQDTSSSDHAEKSLRCAIKIQEDNLRRNLDAAQNGEPVYPLRIGINTSSCYLGDLGSGDRIDFTVVGNGVNFAKRLEGASEMHSVLIGATTNDLVKGIGLPGKAFTKRFIRIKHHSELVEAYEYDPFHDEPELRLAALEGFRKCANIERVDQRWPVHDPSKIQLVCDFGEGQLVNFSHTGLSIKLRQLLAKGTRLNISLDAAGGSLKSLLAKQGIDVLQGEVRWGYAEAGEFVLGVVLTNCSDEKSDFLVQYLCEFAFTREAKEGRIGGGHKAS